MLVDANLLLFAVDASSHLNKGAAAWLSKAVNGPGRVGLPWLVLTAFLRIITNPRASDHPLAPEAAWAYVQDWLTADTVWIPGPTDRHARILETLVTAYRLRGNLITDAQLAALAIEHGLTIYSADTDFARFTEIRWVNPLAGQG
jgi:toxin-antitoxin system PIN domain toxin